MMECTSEMKFKSDSEQNGTLDSNVIVLLSPPSDHSDKRSDPVVVERELAHELAASEQATKVLSETTTISFEEALERELEFRKRMKIVMLQASTDSGSLCIPSQVLTPKPSLAGIKRKAVSENLSEQGPYGSQYQGSPKQHQALQARVQRLQNNRPSMQQLQHQKPSRWLNQGRWLPTQGLNYRSPFPQHTQNQHLRHSMGKQPSLQQSENLEAPPNGIASFWCNLCKVNCTNTLNLKFHHLGKKHKAKCEEVFGSKKTRLDENVVNESKNNEIVWCKECDVPCMKGVPWDQHCAGKRHAARLLALQSQKLASGPTISGKAAVSEHTSGSQILGTSEKIRGSLNNGPP